MGHGSTPQGGAEGKDALYRLKLDPTGCVSSFLSNQITAHTCCVLPRCQEGYPGTTSLLIFWFSAQKQTGPKDRCLGEVTMWGSHVILTWEQSGHLPGQCGHKVSCLTNRRTCRECPAGGKTPPDDPSCHHLLTPSAVDRGRLEIALPGAGPAGLSKQAKCPTAIAPPLGGALGRVQSFWGSCKYPPGSVQTWGVRSLPPLQLTACIQVTQRSK